MRFSAAASIGEFDAKSFYGGVGTLVAGSVVAEHRSGIALQAYGATFQASDGGPTICFPPNCLPDETKRFTYVLIGPQYVLRIRRFTASAGIAGGFELTNLRAQRSLQLGTGFRIYGGLSAVGEWRLVGDAGRQHDEIWQAGIAYRFK